MWGKVCVLVVAFLVLLAPGVALGQTLDQNIPAARVEVKPPPKLPNPNLAPTGNVRGVLPLVAKPSVNGNLAPALPKAEQVVCACTETFYQTGDRVVAAIDYPQGASGILAGHMGTVICGYPAQPGYLPILISWDGWSQGHNGNGACECPAVALPDTSGWWVDCPDVLPANGTPVDCSCSSQFFAGSRVTAAVDNPADAPDIFIGHPGTVVCGDSFSNVVLIGWDNWIQGHNGHGYCECPDTTLADTSAWWVNCTDVNLSSEVNCQCGGYFTAGQRVKALVDNPSAAPGILAGHEGTVVCGITPPDFPTLLVSWDGWNSGHNGNGYCGCPVTSLPDSSGWYVYCDEVGGCHDDWWETRGANGTDDECWGPYLGVPGVQDHLHCDVDWVYLINAQAGVTYTIQTENLTGGADTVIELYGTCTHFIASDDDSGPGLGSMLVVTAATSEPWDLKIREYGDSYDAGEGYTLTFTNGGETMPFADGFESGDTSHWSLTVP